VASGIIESRQAEVEARLAEAGLLVVERRVDGDWLTLRLLPSA
jgi:ribosomal protein L11 methylase PrmA